MKSSLIVLLCRFILWVKFSPKHPCRKDDRVGIWYERGDWVVAEEWFHRYEGWLPDREERDEKLGEALRRFLGRVKPE